MALPHFNVIFFRDVEELYTQAAFLRMKLTLPKIRRETLWPFLLAGTITFCSGMPATLPTFALFQIDKLGHFAAYGALATTMVRIAGVRRWVLFGGWWALILASAYGLGDEFRQSLTQGIRQYDLADWTADTVGALIAVALYMYWPWYRRLMETPVRRKKPETEVAVVVPEMNPLGARAEEERR